MSKSQTAFGKYLDQHGVKVAVETLGDYVSMARKLRDRPDQVAPNSPILPRLAKQIDRPLEEILPFAKAPPMKEWRIQKTETQIAKGTVPRGRRRTAGRAKKQKPPAGRGTIKNVLVKNPLGIHIHAAGRNMREVAERLHVPAAMLWRISTGLINPNHPLLPRLAKEIGMPLAKLVATATKPPLRERWLTQAQQEYGGNGGRPVKRNGKAVVLASQIVDSGSRNGEHKRNVLTGPIRTGPYNRLRKAEDEVRQATRVMITTLNMAIMGEHETIPPVPTTLVYLVLSDYLQEKGIKASVLIDPKFVALFDKK